MNIYNFTYCFFYKLWEKQGTDGRLSGTGIVFFTLLMHILLILEIIFDLTGHKLSLFPHHEGASYSQRKNFNLIFCIPFIIAIWLFYNRYRTDKLLKEYEIYYEGDESKISLRILLYVVLPPILLLVLALIRQKLGTLNI